MQTTLIAKSNLQLMGTSNKRSQEIVFNPISQNTFGQSRLSVSVNYLFMAPPSISYSHNSDYS